jgi:hypothetical protein
MHTAEPLVPEPCYLVVEIATEKQKGINCHMLMKYQQNWSKAKVSKGKFVAVFN